MARLTDQYQSEMVEALMKKTGYNNIMDVVKSYQNVINRDCGEAKNNTEILDPV